MKNFSKIAIIGTGLGVGVLGVLHFVKKSKQHSSLPNNVQNYQAIIDLNLNPMNPHTETVPYASRGLRNNNPGNIRINDGNPWKGKIPRLQNTDGIFEQFVTLEYGIRALIKLLITYNRRYNLKTIQDIISKYAPNNENNTNSYVAHVSKMMNVPPTEEIELKGQTLYKLVRAIAFIENGKQTINSENYKEALKLI